MNGPAVPAQRTLTRRLVLGAALFAALAVASIPRAELVHAQPNPPSVPAPPAPREAPATPATPAAPADQAPKSEREPAAEITVGPAGVTVDRHGKRVRVVGLGRDKDYDSFDELVDDAPWLAGLIFFSVACVFAVPVLIAIAIVWYKMRRTRMLNDTMLKLAEKGVVPLAGALEALVANKPEVVDRAVVGSAPLAEQVRLASKRAAWSDLRKGIVMLAIGLGLSVWSLLDSASANSIGLVLLFLGIGYIVLWWFEERRIGSPGGSGPATGT